jgi:hypothetical protein
LEVEVLVMVEPAMAATALVRSSTKTAEEALLLHQWVVVEVVELIMAILVIQEEPE